MMLFTQEPTPTKLCRDCGDSQPASGFRPYKGRDGKHYLSNICRDCHNKRSALERLQPHRFAAEKRKTMNKVFGDGAYLHYQEVLYAQGERCAICLNPDGSFGRVRGGRVVRKMHSLDHNHRTGQVRGALCHCCNAGIVDLGDRDMWVGPPVLREEAERYLEEWETIAKKGGVQSGVYDPATHSVM